ncbi:MAG: nucleotidyltransferase domain-containing protein [Limnochordales bacterium]|nr:nucleotidyltransferase domain-containing protein [Limnochordales bacterium]
MTRVNGSKPPDTPATNGVNARQPSQTVQSSPQATQPWRLKLGEALEKAVKQIVEGYDPEKIFLFGSMARGDIHADSDIDLLIIKETSRKFLDRISDVLSVINVPVPIEPIVYTPEEFQRLQAEKRDFTETVMREAKLIYERRGNQSKSSRS